MIYSELVRLKLTPKQTYQLPIFDKGISRIWHYFDYYKNEVVAQYIGSTTNQYHPVYREQIEKELEHISKYIIQDGVKMQEETPRKLGTLEILVEHPAYRRERDAIKKHFKNARTINVPKADLKRLNEHYDKVYKDTIKPDKIKEDGSADLEVGIIEDGNDIRSL